MLMSSMNDHRYALDVYGKWVDAKKTEYQKYSSFFCDCPDRHRMRLVKPSGDLGKRPFCDYFAHNVKRMKLSHDNDSVTPAPTCASGGESDLHRRAKHVLREMVGQYRFTTFRCLQCRDEECEETVGCSVTIEVRSADGRWRYDCLLKRDNTPVAALEVVHTHLTGEEKASAVRAGGLKIAEFRAQDVLDIVGKGGVVQLENLLVRLGRCHACLLKRSIQWLLACYSDERKELIQREMAEFYNYMRADELRRSREHADKLECILREADVVKRCKLLLARGLRSGVRLCIPEVGTVTCSETEEWEYGLLGSGFNTPLNTTHVCIVILQDGIDVRSLKLRWNYNGIERRFYLFINCATILQRLSTVMEEGWSLCLRDCRPHKQFQRHMGREPVPKNRQGTCDSWYGGVFATYW